MTAFWALTDACMGHIFHTLCRVEVKKSLADIDRSAEFKNEIDRYSVSCQDPTDQAFNNDLVRFRASMNHIENMSTNKIPQFVGLAICCAQCAMMTCISQGIGHYNSFKFKLIIIRFNLKTFIA